MTAQQLQRELLEQLEQPFTGEALFDCLSDLCFFMKNLRGEYVLVNWTLVQRCGLQDKSQIVGRTPEQVFPPPLGTTYRLQDEAVLRTGEPILDRLELQLYPSGRRGWCLTNKVPLAGKRGRMAGLVGISKDLQAPNEEGEDYSAVARAVQRIQTAFDEPLKVHELAALAGFSVYQFEQRVRRIFHITAGQFIQKTRMDAALRRLRDTDTPIAEVAIACGYSDQSAFSRQFKQTTGFSPAQYRKATAAVLSQV
jgi:AraC-like DNA-binding protein